MNPKMSKRKIRTKNKISCEKINFKLIVFRSNSHIYGQIVDNSGKVLVSESDLKIVDKNKKVDNAKVVGEKIAEKAKKIGIREVIFSKNGYQYHGRIAKLADAARQAGLKF